jgi:hypothetical protein
MSVLAAPKQMLILTEVLREADPKLVNRFSKYHNEHPEVWDNFKKYAAEMRATGRRRYSAWAIINRIRWDHDMAKTEEFKISNDYIALYARIAIHLEPELATFFVTRPMKSERFFDREII